MLASPLGERMPSPRNVLGAPQSCLLTHDAHPFVPHA
jgi:hypothetical protein